jgi:hypothetical protein
MIIGGTIMEPRNIGTGCIKNDSKRDIADIDFVSRSLSEPGIKANQAFIVHI